MRNKATVITSWDEIPLIFDIPIMTRLLGRSYDNVKKMCQQGQLPVFKVGDEWRFEKESVRNWVRNQEENAKRI